MSGPGLRFLEGPDGGFPAPRHVTVDGGRGKDDPLRKRAADRALWPRSRHGMVRLELGPTVGATIVVGGHVEPHCSGAGLGRSCGSSPMGRTAGHCGRVGYRQRGGWGLLTPNCAEVTSVRARFSASMVGARSRRVSTSQTQPLTVTSLGISG